MQLISFRTGRRLDVEAPEVPLRGCVGVHLPSGQRSVLTAVRTGREGAGPEALGRLQRLATARGQGLRRPLAAAIDGPRLLVASEPADGALLRTVIRLVPLTWDQAAVLGDGLLAALASVHRLQVAHGAVGLDSAVLCRDGRLRLVDAGLPQPIGEQPASLRSDMFQAAAPLSSLFSELTPATVRPVPKAAQEQLKQLIELLRDKGWEGSAEEALSEWRKAVRLRLDSEGRARVTRQLRVLAGRLPGVGPGVPLPDAAAISAAAAGPVAAVLPEPALIEPATPVSPLAEPAISTASKTEESSAEKPEPMGPAYPIPAPVEPAAPLTTRAEPVMSAASNAEESAAEKPEATGPAHPALPWTQPVTSLGPRPDPVMSDASKAEESAADEPERLKPAYPLLPPLSPTRSPSWNWRWLSAGVVLLLLIVGGGGAFEALHHEAKAPGGSGRAHARATATPTPAPFTSPSPSPTLSTTPTVAPVLAPSSDPPVQQVQLVSDCQPTGASDCQYTVTANLSAHPAVTVSWEVEAVDQCTGSVTEMASGAVAAPGNYTYVDAQPQINVPSGYPVWLVALAGAPGRAASAPVTVTPPASSCGT